MTIQETTLNQPSRTPYENYVVKIAIPETQEASQAHITNEKGTIRMWVPIDMVRKRLASNETVAFFKAQVKSSIGVLEIGERVPDEDW
jgi:hypothetical protein